MTWCLLSFYVILCVSKIYAFTCDSNIIDLNNSTTCQSGVFPPGSSMYPSNTNCTLRILIDQETLLKVNITFTPANGDNLTFYDGKDTFYMDSSNYYGIKQYYFTTTVTFVLKSVLNSHGTLKLDWSCNMFIPNSTALFNPYDDDYRILTFESYYTNAITITPASATQDPYALILAHQDLVDDNTPMFFYAGNNSSKGAYLGRYSTILKAGPLIYNDTLTIVVAPSYWNGPNVFIALLKVSTQIDRYKFYRFYAYNDPQLLPTNIEIDASGGPAAAVIYQTLAVNRATYSGNFTALDWYTETDGFPSQPIFSFNKNNLNEFTNIPLPIIGDVNTLALEEGGSVTLNTIKINGTSDSYPIYPAQRINILNGQGTGFIACSNYAAHTSGSIINHYTNCTYSLPENTLANVNFTAISCDNSAFQFYNGAVTQLGKNDSSLILYAINNFQLSYPDSNSSCKLQFTMEKYNISGNMNPNKQPLAEGSSLLFYLPLLLVLVLC